MCLALLICIIGANFGTSNASVNKECSRIPQQKQYMLADTCKTFIYHSPSTSYISNRGPMISLSNSGSPKYFGPILHYLRTNSFDIPPDYQLSTLRTEAEYFGIQKIVDHIDYLEDKKRQEESQQPGKPPLCHVCGPSCRWLLGKIPFVVDVFFCCC